MSAKFSSRKWVACLDPSCEGGADIYADNDNGRAFVAQFRPRGHPVYVYGDPEAKCNMCGAPLPMPTATAEQMDSERNPLYQFLQDAGLIQTDGEDQP